MGFPMGFWVVCGTLALKKSNAYFQFVDEAKNRLYVLIAINVSHFKRKMERNGVGSSWLKRRAILHIFPFFFPFLFIYSA